MKKYIFPILLISAAVPAISLTVSKSNNRDFYSELIDNNQHLFRKQHAEKLSTMMNRSNSIDWESRETIDPEKGKKMIDTIRDYSIQINTRCGHGTGWFLDYVVPEGKGETYPSKWFIATNAHVINKVMFWENPYSQILPLEEYGARFLNSCNSEYITLSKETVKTDESKDPIESDPSYWNLLKLNSGESESVFGTNQNLQYKVRGKEYQGRSTFTDRNPKLFYIPIDHLGKKPTGYRDAQDSYYHDFAIIEVDFKSGETAKAMTRGLYDKYGLADMGSGKSGINLFKEENLNDYLKENYSLKQRNFFTAGYPNISPKAGVSCGNMILKPSLSIDSKTKSPSKFSKPKEEKFYASKLTNEYGNYRIKADSNRRHSYAFGLYDAGKLETEGVQGSDLRLPWGNRRLWNWGYNYILDNLWMSHGASGSMVTDGDGNVLGLYRMEKYSQLHGYVLPLRSSELKIDNRVVSPAYDLIEGVTGQKSSYKTQVQKYLLANKRSTGLSKWRKWTCDGECVNGLKKSGKTTTRKR